MVLYSSKYFIITFNEDCNDFNLLTILFREKHFYHFLLPKFFNRSIISYILSRVDGYDFYQLMSDLFYEIDSQTLYELSEAGHQDFLKMIKEYRSDAVEEGY